MFKSSPAPLKDRLPSSPCTTVQAESIVRETVESAEKIISRWWYSEDSDQCTAVSLFKVGDGRENAEEFISAVDNVQYAIRLFSSAKVASKLLLRCQELVQVAMKRLVRELQFVFRSNGEDLDPASVSLWFSERSSEKTKAQAMIDLKCIADCMINCGYTDDCVKTYKSVRKSVVDGELCRLGIDRSSLSFQPHKIDWEVIEERIKNWLSASKIAMKSIFSGERILCDAVFVSSPKIAESTFFDLAKDSALSLLGFPEQVASKCKKSPERLFRILDLYEAIVALSPEINHTFASDSTSAVRSQVESTLLRLRETARAAIVDFESAIRSYTSKTPVTGGGVHPVTRYVMNYLVFLADYTRILEEILANWPLILHAPLPEEFFGFQKSGVKKANVAVRFAWLILVLLSKLDSKAELYNDVSLSYLFLANNLRYIVGKVRSSDLRRIVGDDWAAKQDEKVGHYASSYERVGWSSVIAPLLDGHDEADSSHRTAEERARERFRKFNGAFLEAQRKHVEWVVVDPSLRLDIKNSLERNVVSKYRRMYEKYRDKLVRKNGKADPVVRYAPEDLENYFWGLLFGCSDGESRSRSKAKATSFSCPMLRAPPPESERRRNPK